MSYADVAWRASMRARVLPLRPVSAALLAALLSACGGGGDSAPTVQTQSQAQGEAPSSGRMSAQAVSPASGLIGGDSWALVPHTLPDTSTYTRSDLSGRTVYYVDPDGNDTQNDGKSPSTPWKTLNKVQGFAFQPGDAILLKCGGVWEERLILRGDADAKPIQPVNLLIGAYAKDSTPANACTDANRPKIKGNTSLRGVTWAASDLGAGIYKATLSQAMTRLFRNGEPEMPARYPNPQPGKIFARASTLNSKNSFKIRGAELEDLKNRELKDATVYLRTVAYMVEAAKVASFEPTTGVVVLDRDLVFTIKENTGYILEGQSWMVDQPGEWWFDAATKVLHYKAATAPTADSGLEAGVRDRGIWVYAVAGLQIERLRFEGHEEAGIVLDATNNAVVRDVVVTHSHNQGIYAGGSPGTQVLNSRVDAAGMFGVDVFNSNGSKVVGNLVTRTGKYRVASPFGAKGSPRGAIRAQGDNTLADGNYVFESAVGGIIYGKNTAEKDASGKDIPKDVDNLRTGTTVTNNTVVRPCLMLTDCGGIYTSSGYEVKPGEIRNRVLNNIVAGVKSNLDGTNLYGTNVNLVAGVNQAVGIYLDDLAANVEVANNLVADAEVGIYVHNGVANRVHDNVVRGATYTSFLGSFDHDVGTPDVMRKNELRNNTFFSHRTVSAEAFKKSPVAGVQGDVTHAQLWLHKWDATAFFKDSAVGANDRNVSEGNRTLTLSKVQAPAVWRKEAGDVLEQVSGAVWGLRTGTMPYVKLGLSQWLDLTKPTTKDTEASPVSFQPYKVSKAATTSMLSNGAFSVLGGGWTATGARSVYLTGLSSCMNTASTCLMGIANEPAGMVSSRAFDLTQGTLYTLNYTAAAGTTAARHGAVLRTSGATGQDKAMVAPVSAFKVKEVRRIESFVRPTASEKGVSLALRLGDGTSAWINKGLYFADASMYPLSGEVQVAPPLSQLGVLAVNASTASRKVYCEDLGLTDCTNVVDDQNAAVSFPVTVDARSARQLYFRLTGWAN